MEQLEILMCHYGASSLDAVQFAEVRELVAPKVGADGTLQVAEISKATSSMSVPVVDASGRFLTPGASPGTATERRSVARKASRARLRKGML